MTTSVERIPHLESGDRLTRHEFERRYTVKLICCTSLVWELMIFMRL